MIRDLYVLAASFMARAESITGFSNGLGQGQRGFYICYFLSFHLRNSIPSATATGDVFNCTITNIWIPHSSLFSAFLKSHINPPFLTINGPLSLSLSKLLHQLFHEFALLTTCYFFLPRRLVFIINLSFFLFCVMFYFQWNFPRTNTIIDCLFFLSGVWRFFFWNSGLKL